MNTVRSVGYGWGVLVVAGGSAYWLAKRSINVDREARAQVELERRRRQEQLRQADRLAQMSQISSLPPASSTPSVGTKFVRREDNARGGSESVLDPSVQASEDPAPVGHAPVQEGERVKERGKYEATEPWRSRKGDRLG